MRNKQPRRQRCEPKLYTESDLRRMTREVLLNVERHHMKLCIGSFALALHRNLHLPADQIADVLKATGEYSLNALCFTDVQRELKEETGLDLSEYTETI